LRSGQSAITEAGTVGLRGSITESFAHPVRESAYSAINTSLVILCPFGLKRVLHGSAAHGCLLLDGDQLGLCLVDLGLLFLLALDRLEFGTTVGFLPFQPNGLLTLVVSLRDGRQVPPNADGDDCRHKSAAPAYELPEGKENGHCCTVTFVVVSLCSTADCATASLPLLLPSAMAELSI